jgi:hypothetical protein
MSKFHDMTYGDLLEYFEIPSDEAHNYDRLALLDMAKDEDEDDL